MKEKIKNNKSFAIIITILIYLIAFIACYVLYPIIKVENILLKFLILDIIATIIVFIGSMICNNSSIYDPYWSVAPMVMAPLFMILTNVINPFTIIVVVLVEIWGARLTISCLKRWKSLSHQDWRYNLYQTKHPKLWPLISLSGIHLMPTLVVFMGMLPLFSYMNAFNEGVELNVTWIMSLIVCVASIIIETIADLQMDRFKKEPNNQGKINKTGLWKNSRHPNYFGEIMFWFSMFLFALSVQETMWILMFSPLIVFLLFVVITIPMMEKRQIENKPEYLEYKKETNNLLPIWPPVKEENKK